MKIKIRNTQTGEVKEIDSGQAGNYGVSSSQPQKSGGFLNGLANLLPAIGGTIGGIGGGIAGSAFPGAGTVAGAIGGGGVGTAGGEMLRQLLTGQHSLGNLGKEAGVGAASSAVGEGAGRALGFLAHPIQPFVGKVNSILANSAKNVDLGSLLSSFRQTQLPQFAQKGLGQEAGMAYRSLVPRIQEMITSQMPHIPATNEAPLLEGQLHQMVANAYNPFAQGVDILDNSNVPISLANEIKRNISGLGNLLQPAGNSTVGGSYGKLAKPGLEVPKQFQRLLKEEIQNLEPGVKLPNKIASTMYGAEGLAKIIPYLLPIGYKGQRAASKLGATPFNILQHLLPPANSAVQPGQFTLAPLLNLLFQGHNEGQ